MKNTPIHSSIKIALLALVALLFSTKTFAHNYFDCFLELTNEKGQVTKFKVAEGGSFEASVPAGTYACSVSFKENPANTGGRGHVVGEGGNGIATNSGGSSDSALHEIHQSIPPKSVVLTYEVKSPRDVATGQASGKRQHSQVTITKEWGAASPQLSTGRNLTFTFHPIEIDNGDKIIGNIKLLLANGKTAGADSWTGK